MGGTDSGGGTGNRAETDKMVGTPFGRGALAAAWLGGGGVFVALAAWDWTGTAEQARFVRLGVVWMLLGAAHLVTTSTRYRAWADGWRGRWSKLQSTLLGLGVALVLVGFVLSGAFLLWFGVSGLLLVAVALLGGL